MDWRKAPGAIPGSFLPFLGRKSRIKRKFLPIQPKFPPVRKTRLNKSVAECATMSVVATGGRRLSKPQRRRIKRFMKRIDEQKLYIAADVRRAVRGRRTQDFSMPGGI